MATGFQGSFEEFIQMNDEGFTRGVGILHRLGGSAIELGDNRAVTQTKMTISQRGALDGVVCDPGAGKPTEAENVRAYCTSQRSRRMLGNRKSSF